MTVRGIGHVNYRAPAATIERLRRFYIDIIALREGPRPTFRSGSLGHWLYAGGQAVMHLTIAPDTETAPRHASCFNHLAFDCDDLAAARARLDAAGIAYTTDVVDERRQVQLFLLDPAGVGVEMTFVVPPGSAMPA